MQIKNRIRVLVLLSGCMATGHVLAASVTGDVIYQKMDSFYGSAHITDSFTINARGLYQAKLTDFETSSAFKSSGLEVTHKSDSLGKLAGPGMFTFQAGPGDYNVNMFAVLGPLQASEKEKQRLIDEEHQRRVEIKAALWDSLTKEQKWARKEQHKEIWESMSEAERQERQERREKARNKWVENQLASMNTGKYGIEISRLGGLEGTGVSAVPLPAAAWLFGSGMLALAGLGRRKNRQ